jgi:hypothetical protein
MGNSAPAGLHYLAADLKNSSSSAPFARRYAIVVGHPRPEMIAMIALKSNQT